MKDPNQQIHHTYGGSPAAERLKKEIDKGLRHGGAIAILNKGQAYANELIKIFSYRPNGKYFLQLLHKDIRNRINATNADKIIKSLCNNIFTAKYRKLLKLPIFK